MNTVHKAILLTVVSVAFFSLLNCLTKLLMHRFGTYEILCYRSFISMAICFFFIISLKKQNNTQFTRVNLLRGLFDFASIPLWMLALHHMQVTQVVSIAFLTPIVCAVMAAIFLKDRMPLAKCVACVISLFGVFIIAKPDINGFNYYSFAVLAVCALWGASGVMLKQLSIQKQPPLLIMAYTNLVIFLMTIPFAFGSFTIPYGQDLVIILIMGVVAFLGNFAMANAYGLTRITNLLPFEYLKLIFSAIFAFFLFGEVIKVNTFIGSAIILAVVFYVSKGVKEKPIESLKAEVKPSPEL